MCCLRSRPGAVRWCMLPMVIGGGGWWVEGAGVLGGAIRWSCVTLTHATAAKAGAG